MRGRPTGRSGFLDGGVDRTGVAGIEGADLDARGGVRDRGRPRGMRSSSKETARATEGPGGAFSLSLVVVAAIVGR